MNTSHTRHGLLHEVQDYWHGDGPLWKLYWIYGVALSTLGGAFILTAVMQRALPVGVLLLLLLGALGYTGLILLGIWRNAFNIAGAPFGIAREAWGWIARILTFGWAINAAGGALMLLQYTMNY